jgi:hypothetical protein
MSKYRCLSNPPKDRKPHVDHANAVSGQTVEWLDEPDERMRGTSRAEHGSIWSSEHDLSAWWSAYYASKEQPA